MIFVPHLKCNPNQYDFLIAETFKVLPNNAAINPESLMSIDCCFVEILQKMLAEFEIQLKAEVYSSLHTKFKVKSQPNETYFILSKLAPFVKVKTADVVRCHLLYCTLVPGIKSMGLILYEISPFVYFM